MMQNSEANAKIHFSAELQMIEVRKVRWLTSAMVRSIQHHALLSVGDGVSWHSTWLSQDLEFFPSDSSSRQVFIVDKEYSTDSILNMPVFCHQHDIRPIVANALHLPFPGEQFDIVVCSLMIDDCESHTRLLGECRRCLSSDGILAISGHGIDVMRIDNPSNQYLGSHHRYPTTPNRIERIAEDVDLGLEVKWNGMHAWLRVFRRFS